LKRETSALIECSKELLCNDLIIITWDEEKIIYEKNVMIKIIPVWKWLL